MKTLQIFLGVLAAFTILSGAAKLHAPVLFASLFSLHGSYEEIDLDARKILDSERGEEHDPDVAEISENSSCVDSVRGVPTRAVLMNEVAWMGIPGESAREWVELKNISADPVSIRGWRFMDKDGKIDMRIARMEPLLPGTFYILTRGSDTLSSIKEREQFMGTINNSGEILRLFDANCGLVDEVVADPSWPAGESATGKTAERGSDFSWHTSRTAGGTPAKENSEDKK